MSSNEWQPERGERVIAVLPDGHEIEGYYGGSAANGTNWVHFGRRDWQRLEGREGAWVRTVKPLLVTEPTAFGARVVDGGGRRFVRNGKGYWGDATGYHWFAWSDLPQPVRVIDADPDWNDPR